MIPPSLQEPTIEEICETAAKNNIRLSKNEAADFAEFISEMLDGYERLDELYEQNGRNELRERGLGYRPSDDQNPHNEFLVKCDISESVSGPLSGYNIGIKDSIAVAGLETMCGSFVLSGYVSKTDATVVTRVLQAGGCITGKTNMEPFGYSGSGELCSEGPVLNPYDRGHLAGGSSSGSAAAVAGGSVDIAFGTDQGGSIRIPAAWCGCVGLKPTFGLIPYTGIIGMEPSVDHVGPMSMTVEECALALEVTSGVDGLDARQNVGRVEPKAYTDLLAGDLEDFTIGLLSEGFDPTENEQAVNDVVYNAVEALASQGAKIQEVSVPLHMDGQAIFNGIEVEGMTSLINDEGIGKYMQGYYDTQFLNAFSRARRLQADEFPPTLKLILTVGQYLSDEYHGRYYAKAQNLRRDLRQQYDEALEVVDILAMPTTPQTAHKARDSVSHTGAIERALDMTRNTAPFNITGHPSISIPCGTVDGLPVGLMFVGEHQADNVVLDAAYGYQEQIGYGL